MNDDLDDSKSADYLMGAAIGLTVITILLFLVLSIEKDIFELKLNEIGDSIAGFSGSLAFLWLTVTVFLQSKELRLQRKELAGVKEAANEQALTLKLTFKVQAVQQIRSRMNDVLGALVEIRDGTSETIVNFIKNTESNPYSSEFMSNPASGIPFLVAYFMQGDCEDEVSMSFFGKLRGGEINFIDKIEHENYLAVVQILYNMDRAAEIFQPIYDDAIKYEIEDECISWLQKIGIYWYKKDYCLVYCLYIGLTKAIAEKQIGGMSEQHATIAKVSLEMRNMQVIRIPFFGKKL